MTIIGDKQISYEPKLLQKLDTACERCTKKKFDNLLIVEGMEGYGKSTIAVMVGYYISLVTGREYTVDNIFFNADDMMEYAIANQDKIIHWDEAALAGMASEWQNRVQKKLIKMLMVARKKRHFYIFCIPKFYKLNEYLIDRAIGMIRVYAEKETELGRFVYYNKENLRYLYNLWKRKKQIDYRRGYTFHGRFANVLPKIIDEEQYEQKKNDAISNVLKDTEKIDKRKIIFQDKMARFIRKKGQNVEGMKKLCEEIGVRVETFYEWEKHRIKYPHLFKDEAE